MEQLLRQTDMDPSEKKKRYIDLMQRYLKYDKLYDETPLRVSVQGAQSVGGPPPPPPVAAQPQPLPPPLPPLTTPPPPQTLPGMYAAPPPASIPLPHMTPLPMSPPQPRRSVEALVKGIPHMYRDKVVRVLESNALDWDHLGRLVNRTGQPVSNTSVGRLVEGVITSSSRKRKQLEGKPGYLTVKTAVKRLNQRRSFHSRLPPTTEGESEEVEEQPVSDAAEGGEEEADVPADNTLDLTSSLPPEPAAFPTEPSTRGDIVTSFNKWMADRKSKEIKRSDDGGKRSWAGEDDFY